MNPVELLQYFDSLDVETISSDCFIRDYVSSDVRTPSGSQICSDKLVPQAGDPKLG